MMRSWASSNRDRDRVGLIECAKYSQPMPRTKPETRRPSVRWSSIAISSATRSGLPRIGIALPSTMIFARLVRRASAAAMMFGDGMIP
jgi:hypothetical protein